MLKSDIEAHVEALFVEGGAALRNIEIVRIMAGGYDETTHKVTTTEQRVSVRAVVSADRVRSGTTEELHPGTVRVRVIAGEIPFDVTTEHVLIDRGREHKILSARLDATGTTWVLQAKGA